MKRACMAIVLLLMTGCTLYTVRMATPTPERKPIAMQNTPAWQSSSPIAMQIAMQTSTPEPPARICTGYDQGRVNVRACGSTRCKILTTLPEGRRVYPLSDRNGWIRIASGWVYGKYICK